MSKQFKKQNTNVKRGQRNMSKTGKSTAKCSKYERMEDIKSNDISWWNGSPLYADATKVSLTNYPGYVKPSVNRFMNGLEYSSAVNLKDEQMQASADPAFAVVKYAPTLGYADNASSPVNRSFTSLYAQIVARTNSSNVGFTQASLAMITLSCSSIANNVAELKRILGLRSLYHDTNNNFSHTFFVPLAGADKWVDYSEIPWETYRVQLNTLIEDFNSLMIPKYLSLFDRAFQLGYNIYADEDSTLAQFHAYMADGYYIYDDINNRVAYNTYNYYVSPNQMYGCAIGYKLDILRQQIAALRSTSDLGLIMGAFRRAFTGASTLQFEIMPPEFKTVPWFDRNMTWQFNNLNLVPLLSKPTLTVTEDVVKDVLLSRPAFAASTSNWVNNGNVLCGGMINSYDNNLSDEFVMEATRMSVHATGNARYTIGDEEGTEIEMVGLDACGTEIPLTMDMYRIVKDDDEGLFVEPTNFQQFFSTTNERPLNETTYVIFLRQCAWVSRFRNHPYMYVSFPNDTSDAFEILPIGDLYAYVTISNDQYKQLSDAALLSCYTINVPTIWKD